MIGKRATFKWSSRNPELSWEKHTVTGVILDKINDYYRFIKVDSDGYEQHVSHESVFCEHYLIQPDDGGDITKVRCSFLKSIENETK